MNFSTFSGYIGGTGRNQIVSQTLAATTETEIKVQTDSGTPAIAVLSIPTGSGIGGSVAPLGPNTNASLIYRTGRQGVPVNSSQPAHNSGSFDGRPFLLRIAGVATPASNAGNTLAIKLYCGTSKSGTNLATTGAVPQATTTTSKNFILEAQLLWDSTSQVVNGQFWFNVPGTSGTTYTTWAALSNTATSIALTGMNFCASVTWGNAIGGVVAVSEMSLSEL